METAPTCCEQEILEWAGKIFPDAFANYLLNIFPLGQNRHFESSFSTSSGGGGGGRSGEIGIKDSQTGSASVYKKRKTRSKESEKTVADQKTKYSDVSVYCHTLGLYCICGEVKSDEDDTAASQNVEQLLGLWRPNQKFILGWTLNPKSIIARLLVRSGERLDLYEVKHPNNVFGLLNLARLYMAIFSTLKLGE